MWARLACDLTCAHPRIDVWDPRVSFTSCALSPGSHWCVGPSRQDLPLPIVVQLRAQTTRANPGICYNHPSRTDLAGLQKPRRGFPSHPSFYYGAEANYRAPNRATENTVNEELATAVTLTSRCRLGLDKMSWRITVASTTCLWPCYSRIWSKHTGIPHRSSQTTANTCLAVVGGRRSLIHDKKHAMVFAFLCSSLASNRFNNNALGEYMGSTPAMAPPWAPLRHQVWSMAKRELKEMFC